MWNIGQVIDVNMFRKGESRLSPFPSKKIKTKPEKMSKIINE